jgi:hypothetical protein
MKATARIILSNEHGFVLGASILMSAILILAGVLALWTSTTEMHVVRNENELTLEFYNAEGGVIDALENYNTVTTEVDGDLVDSPLRWLTNEFLSSPTTTAKGILQSVDADGKTVARVEVRCIENTGTAVDGLSAAANTLPLQRHLSAPPAGSGFSLKHFEVRRYGLTATSATGNTRVQVGAYKVFNKF